jgi:tape measure domain-containing protein
MADIALRIMADFKDADKAFNSLTSESENLKKKFNDVFSSSETVQNSIQKNTERIKLNSIAVTATRGAAAGLATEQRGLRSEIERQIKGAVNPQNEALNKLRSRYAEVSKEVEKTQKASKTATVSIKSMITAIAGANVIEGAVRSLGRGFKFIVDEAKKMEDVKAAYIPLMGGAKQAEKLVKALNVAAAETPYQFETISDVTKQLLPLMNGDIEKTVETMKMLGDTAGGNAQKLDSITRGFSKTMMKGKVDMQSLNMIADAGVPIYAELSKNMGYGKDRMGEFFKAVSAGKIPADALTDTFKKMTSEGGIFFEGMILASKTTSGVMSTMRDNISITAAGIGQEFLPYLKEGAIQITKMTASILKWISEGDNFKNLLSSLGTAISIIVVGLVSWQTAAMAVGAAQKISAFYTAAMATIMPIYAAATAAATAGTWSFGAAFKALTALMMSNPIGLIAVAIAGLIVLIYKAIKNIDLIKFHIEDFALTAKIKMMEVGQSINDGVIAAIGKMVDVMQYLPGMGSQFALVTNAIKSMDEASWGSLETEKQKQASLRESFALTQKKIETDQAAAEAEKDLSAQSVATTQAANEQKRASNQKLNDDTLAAQQKQMEMYRKIQDEFYLSDMERAELKYQAELAQLERDVNAFRDAEGKRTISVEEEARIRGAIEGKYRKTQVDEYKKMVQSISDLYSTLANTVTGLMSAMGAVAKAEHGNRMNELDREYQQKLIDNGFIVESEADKAQKQLDIARETGSEEEILLAQKNLNKAHLDEEYHQKKTQMAYEEAIREWELNKSLALINIPLMILQAALGAAKYGPEAMIVAGAAAGVIGWKQYQAISTAKPSSPSGLTGLEYTVPDTPSNRLDQAPVRATAGETVSITPRGMEGSKNIEVNIQLEDSVLIRAIQRYIDTGRVKVSNRNIGRGVFAT